MGTGRLSKARLGRMRGVMAGHVERGPVPGLVMLVSRRDEEHVDAIGTTAVGGTEPMRRDSIFRISSMTKPITAVAAMILVEEGKLRLDEPVDPLLPELADRRVLRSIDGRLDDTVPANRPITVRDLLTFRMGFGQMIAAPDAYPVLATATEQHIGMGPPRPATMPHPDEWMRRLGALPLMHQPGQRWMYNTGSDVLGVLIARASGQSLGAFLRERLFEPLGMRDTGFSVAPEQRDRLVTSYWSDSESGDLEVYDEPDGQWSSPPAFPSGAGGLVSTVDDYLAFGRMLLANGRHGSDHMLSPRSVETMTTNHLTPEQAADAHDFLEGNGWGFGVSVVTTGDDATAGPGRYGWDGGLGTSWATDPEQEMVGILLTQCSLTSPAVLAVRSDFWASAYEATDD